MQPRLIGGALIARDGARLPMRHWQADGEARGSVIALHGFTDYSAAFERMGPWLAGLGFDVYAYDQRGFGEAPHPGLWPGGEALVGDLEDAMEAIRRNTGDASPLYIIGESMGGSVAIMAAATMNADPPSGLILAAPGVREDLRFRYMWNALFWSAAHLAPGFSWTVSRERDGSLIPSASKRLRDDPLVIHDIRADSYHGVVRLADQASIAAADLETPVLMLHGGRDDLIPRVSICAAFEAIPGEKAIALYADAPHLLLHWREQAQVFEDIRRWLSTDDGFLSRDRECL